MDLKQLFQEWYASNVSRWHSEGTPKEVIAQESFFFGVQAAQQSAQSDAAYVACPYRSRVNHPAIGEIAECEFVAPVA